MRPTWQILAIVYSWLFVPVLILTVFGIWTPLAGWFFAAFISVGSAYLAEKLW